MTDTETTLEPEGLEQAARELPREWPGGFEDQTQAPKGGWLHPTWTPNDRARAVAARIIRAYLSRSTLPRDGQGVAVKPLEWVTIEEGMRCITVCGAYAISPSSGAYGKPTLTLTGMPGNLFGKFDTIEEAKATAQADFTIRILSALSPSPAVRGGDDDVRQLLMAIENAARMSEQGILSADGGQAATEIRALVPLKFRRALSTQEQGK